MKLPDGSWTDVDTSPDEAAVFLGAATEQATAGLLKAATYRVVSATPLHAPCIGPFTSLAQGMLGDVWQDISMRHEGWYMLLWPRIKAQARYH